MPSLLRRAAIVLLTGLSVTAIALEAGAQVAPERAPLAVAMSPERAAPQLTEAPPAAIVGVGAGVFALGLTDVGFAVYDTVKATRGERSGTGAGIAEIVVAAPQAIVSNGVQIFLTTELAERDPGMAAFVLLPGVTNALLLHGALSNTPSSAQPAALYGLSWAAGFDTAFTLPAIGAAARGKLFPRVLGALEMAFTAPQIAVASANVARDPRDFAPIVGWSGALFVHGLLSVALPPRDPPPAAEPPKRPLQVPSSIEVAPAPVAQGGGLRVSGRW